MSAVTSLQRSVSVRRCTSVAGGLGLSDSVLGCHMLIAHQHLLLHLLQLQQQQKPQLLDLLLTLLLLFLLLLLLLVLFLLRLTFTPCAHADSFYALRTHSASRIQALSVTCCEPRLKKYPDTRNAIVYGWMANPSYLYERIWF